MTHLPTNGHNNTDKENKMPVPVILAGAAAVASRLAAKKIAEQAAKKAVIAAARKKGLATPAQKAALKKASANSAKAAAKVEKRAMKNINKPVPLSNKPLGKLTVMKPKGLKNPVPQTNKWSNGGITKINAATNARTMNTMRPLTSLEKAGFTKPGTKIGGVKTIKPKAK
jgi:hypothetical protein